MPIRRLALLALLTVVSCQDSTGPDILSAPAIRIESPSSGVVIGDTLVQLRGIAQAPGAVDWIEVTYDYVNEGSTSITLYRFDEHFRPDGTIESSTRVPFDVQLRMYAGAKQVTVTMQYRMRPDEPISNAPRSISVTVPFRIWTKPVLKLGNLLPDTVYGRSLSLYVGSVGLDANPSADLVIDPGTANQRQVAATAAAPGIRWPAALQGADRVRLFDVTEPLPNGLHRLAIHLSDEMGAADSIVRSFVTFVAPLAYSVSSLPGLGGIDSDALDVNSAGDVAGWALDASGASRAVLWKAGAVAPLPTSPTALSGQAIDLNDAGDIVGVVDDTVDTGHCRRAIRWTSTTWRYVDAGRSLCFHAAMRVNEAGAALVVGPMSWYGDTTAWLVRDSTVAYFQNFEPSTGLSARGMMSLNDRGEIAGARRYSYGNPTPYSSGQAITFPAFRPTLEIGHPTGALVGLNNAGQALGSYSGTIYYSSQPGAELLDLNPFLLARSTPIQLTEKGYVLAFDPTEHAAYIWRAGRTYRVAVDADWSLDRVSAMNDAGVIVGHATQRSSGRTTAVILRP